MVSPKSFPRIGLGMAALGRPGYINLDRDNILKNGSDERSVVMMQQQANKVLDKLFELTDQPWIDCARSYGLSEQFVSEYLEQRHDVDNLFISSKWGYTYVADWKVTLPPGAPHEIKDHSVTNFHKQLQETRALLGKYLNLYQIHSATFDSGVLTDTTVHEALAQCRRDLGWMIGLSVSGTNQDEIIRAAIAIKVKNSDSTDIPLFDSVQCTYNLMEQKPQQALQQAHDAGMHIIIKEGVANGRILSSDILQKYATQLSCTPDQLALGAILAQDFYPCVLSGAVTPEQLESNWGALEISQRLRKDQNLLQEIMQACRVDSESYWQERSKLAWN